MNKIISFVLLCALLLMCFSGCSFVKDNMYNSETDASNDNVNDKNNSDKNDLTENNGNNSNTVIIEGEMDKSSDLIATLVGYLEQYLMHYDLISRSFAQKIDHVKSGIQPLHVAFDPDNYYFVCGYYNPTPEDNEFGYCCAKNYTWVGYKNESEIKEYYNEMQCIVTFQINKALTVTDVTSNERNVPDIQHFQIFKTTFENGLNINAPIFFDENFIYLDYPYCELKSFSQNTSTLYYSTSIYYHSLVTIPCVYLEDKFYVSIYLYAINADVTLNPPNWTEYSHIIYEFGEYYDDIISIMDTEKYSFVTSDGRTFIFGLISFEDFNNVVKS